MATAPGRLWALHTRARNEKCVAQALEERHIWVYLPLVGVQRIYTKRKVTFWLPLFPGYVFMSSDTDGCDLARRTNRVASVIEVQDQALLRAELQRVYRVLQSGEAAELYPSLMIGKRCRVTAGPLKGLEGTLIRHGRRCRFLVSVTILGQSVAVELDAGLLEVVAESARLESSA